MNAWTNEYEASRAQGIVLDFGFLRGCLGNKEGLLLEVCETLGNKKQSGSLLLHSITGFNWTRLQPAGTLFVLCMSAGQHGSAPTLPSHQNTAIWKRAKITFLSEKQCPLRHPNYFCSLSPFTMRGTSLERNRTNYGWFSAKLVGLVCCLGLLSDFSFSYGNSNQFQWRQPVYPRQIPV